jgi:hypothetical protein
MNLKYSTIGLIAGYLGGYVLNYLKGNQNNPVSFQPNPFSNTEKKENEEIETDHA